MNAPKSSQDDLTKLFIAIRNAINIYLTEKERPSQETVAPQTDRSISTPQVLERIKSALGSDLDIFSASAEVDGSFKLKPKQWLTSNRFREIAEKLKVVDARWVSEGRESHWTIPKAITSSKRGDEKTDGTQHFH